MTETVKTLCPYCGVGCGLEAVLPALKIRGDRAHPSSQGMVCVKGATVAESLAKDRLLYPMWRPTLESEFQRISWEGAIAKIVEAILPWRENPDALCLYGSGQFHTEDYYVAQKLMKGCLGTNNFDANSRLCMSSAVAGYKQSLGSDGPPCCYDDLELTDCCFIIGSNTAECHPIVFNRFRRHHKASGAKLIVVDPRRTETAAVADLHLAIQPGTDIDLLNGMAHLWLQWGTLDRPFIENHTEGFADLVALVQHYTPERVAQRCGIAVEEVTTAARWWSEATAVLSMWSMGINQSAQGTAKVRCLINLHLLTGQIGKPGAGPFSLTGQPNAMGGREAGGLSGLLPGYRAVTDPGDRAFLEEFWGLPPGQISPVPGRSAWDIVRGLEDGSVQFLWIAATNPAVSFPDLGRTKAALRRSPFTVYQDCYSPTETAEFAHLLLPAAQWSEKSGTMTNSERRVTYCPAFRSPPGEAKADWEIFAAVGQRLGFGDQFAWASAAEVYAEFGRATAGRLCDHSELSHGRLAREGPQHWGKGAPARLYTDRQFPAGKARFGVYHSGGMAEPLDAEYPLALTTGRLYGHWHTQTRTGRIDKIRKMHPTPFLEIHPRDAAKLNLQAGDRVRVTSRRGQSVFPVCITQAIAPGVVFVPMHWGALWADNAEANALTHPERCPDALQPELKACAVSLVKVWPR
ncbi:MAG TPA: nitrate reductase catalytic subunit [Cyanobacteria bacterium UBA8156]|jgi:ferredoxin-nitrate reductase|nr:nitrate reductase catalytic subunit [Cyanobacteria bacterium UBA8156]